MKTIKHTLCALLAAAATMACTPEAVDIFPTDPVAPQLTSHSDIIITPSTYEELLTFTWEKARNFNVDHYDFYTVYSSDTLCLGKNLKSTAYSVTKNDFNKLIKEGFALEANVSVSLVCYVCAASDDGKIYPGNTASVTVFSCDESVVPAEITYAPTELVLKADDPSSEIEVLVWNEARYGYNITPKYDVMLKVGDAEPGTLSSGLTGTDGTALCKVTTDDLNNAAVTAGAAAGAKTDIKFFVLSYVDDLDMPAISSDTVTIAVTTYAITFPETLVLAGDYSGHGWSGTDDVKIYLKNAKEGIYKGYVTMMFTETPQTWGFKVVKNGDTWIGSSSDPSGLQHNLVDGGGENMKPASGHYYVETDMINLTLNLTPLTSVGIIGTFNNWSGDVAMTYDDASMTWFCDQTLAANDEFKFRFNGGWAYNLGTGGEGVNGLIHEGDNVKISEAGTYHIVLDMHNTPSFTMTK